MKNKKTEEYEKVLLLLTFINNYEWKPVDAGLFLQENKDFLPITYLYILRTKLQGYIDFLPQSEEYAWTQVKGVTPSFVKYVIGLHELMDSRSRWRKLWNTRHLLKHKLCPVPHSSK